jgi:hypothetical protein
MEDQRMSEKVNKTASRKARLKVLGWVALASMLALVALGPTAGGATASTSLNQTPPISSVDVGLPLTDPECIDETVAAGQVLWHFVLTQTTAGVGTILTVEFDEDGVINSPATKKTGGTLHWYIYTSGDDTLLSASTTANGGKLNLSHVCSGGTLTTTTTTTTTTSTTTTVSSSTTTTVATSTTS